ncbi:cohesin domain-containing protein [Halovivax gelatinilyticus]|uniref:cohesin domain-containing protein n=1 Tax=Halovivax gelatinilyticus TaxID=2961597 RepID=UPI0020CA71EB|nr:cohesin domain-containing protein [Halovivax gelatinilyticus]
MDVYTNADDVAGYGANVTFDPDVLEVDDIVGEDFGDPVVNVNNEEGWVYFTQSQATGEDAPTRFAQIEFNVLEATETDIEFVPDETSINDGSVPPEDIQIDAHSGTTLEFDDEPTEDVLSLVAGEQDGDSIGVELETNADDVAGYGAEVTFDPEIVAVEEVVGVDFGDPVVNVDNDEGTVFFTQSQATGEDAPTLAEIQFEVLETGETDIEFVADETSVNNGSVPPEDIPVDLEGTSISVEADDEPTDDVLSLIAGEQDGDAIGVTIETNADDVAGYGAEVTFDPEIVAVDEVVGVDFGDPVVNVDNDEGTVFFTQSQATGIDAPTVAEIQFEVLETGETDLEFDAEETSVNDGSVPPEDIPVDLEGTSISVEADDEPTDDVLSLIAGEQDGDAIGVELETTVENAAGYQAKLTFDPEIVAVDEVVGVDFGDPVVNVDNDEGTVFFTQSQATGEDAPTLAEIQFEVLTTGESDLKFVAEETSVNDESSNVPVDLEGTSIGVERVSDSDGISLPPPTVSGEAVFSVDSVDLSTTTATVGEPVEIHVELSNVGDGDGVHKLAVETGVESIATEYVTLSSGESTTV